MKSSRFTWVTVATVSIVTTLVFVTGFGYAVQKILYPQAGQAPISKPAPTAQPTGAFADKDKISIVTFGDSLTAGTGDTSGKGYVQRVREKVEAQTGKKTYILNNLAIPGYRTDQLLRDLKEKKNQDALRQANLILFTIGGNDLFQGGQDLINGDQEFDPSVVASRVPKALNAFKEIVHTIREVNPDATVMYVGLYHPFLEMDPDKLGTPSVQLFNDGAFRILNDQKDMLFVPTYDLFERIGVRYLASDHFHPNGDGYERIAERMAQILK